MCLQCGRPGFDPWVGKIPWQREWLPTPVFFQGKSMEWGCWWATVYAAAKSQTIKLMLTLSTFWLFMVSLRTVMALVGVSFSTLMYYSEHKMGLKVHGKWNILPSWTKLVLTSFYHVPWLCYSFKCCTLPPSCFMVTLCMKINLIRHVYSTSWKEVWLSY